MIDLDTQLKKYGEFLDVPLLEPVTRPSRPPSSQRRSLHMATAGLAVVGVLAIFAGVWVRNDAGPSTDDIPLADRGASEPTTGWVRVADTAFSVTPGSESRTTPSGQTFTGVNAVQVASVTSINSTRIAVGSERVGFQTIGAAWMSINDGPWTRLALDPLLFGSREGSYDAEGNALDAVEITAVVQDDGRLIAVGNGLAADQGYSWISDDAGITWQRFTLPGIPQMIVRAESLTIWHDQLVVTGNAQPGDANTGRPLAWTSIDGSTWSATELAADTASVLVGGPAVLGDTIVVPEARCLQESAACNTRPALWVSSDNITWRRIELPQGADQGVVSTVASGDGHLVAFGSETADATTGATSIGVWTSSDGLDWTRRTIEGLPTTAAMRTAGALVHGADGFFGFATDSNGAQPNSIEIRSPDGISWSAAPSTLNGYIQTIGTDGVAYEAFEGPDLPNVNGSLFGEATRIWRLTSG